MRNFYAGQKVRLINHSFDSEHGEHIEGEVMQNEPSNTSMDYYVLINGIAYPFMENELEAVPMVLAGNSRLDKLSLTKELIAVVREISDDRRSSNLAVAYDVARYILKNYDLTKKDGQ